MKIRPAAWITRSDQVLTLRYAYPGGTLFSLPGGGLEEGENLEDTLRRELREELAMTVEVGPLIWAGENSPMHHLPATLHILFRCTPGEEPPRLQPHHTKAQEALWVPLKDIPRLTLYPAVGPWVAHFDTQGAVYARSLPPRPWL